MTAPKIILDLVERFDRNLDAYRAGHYNETQVRREFIDPLFKALGWDINNEIDRLVYGLYGLTEAEIKIVEGAGKC